MSTIKLRFIDDTGKYQADLMASRSRDSEWVYKIAFLDKVKHDFNIVSSPYKDLVDSIDYILNMGYENYKPIQLTVLTNDRKFEYKLN